MMRDREQMMFDGEQMMRDGGQMMREREQMMFDREQMMLDGEQMTQHSRRAWEGIRGCGEGTRSERRAPHPLASVFLLWCSDTRTPVNQPPPCGRLVWAFSFPRGWRTLMLLLLRFFLHPRVQKSDEAASCFTGARASKLLFCFHRSCFTKFVCGLV